MILAKAYFIIKQEVLYSGTFKENSIDEVYIGILLMICII